jgi:MGT family glycosyltransferase
VNFLFVTWAGGGNSTPVLGLATRLAARGHAVKVTSPDDMTARFAAVAVDYEVIGRQPDQVLAAITRTSPDVVLVDFMMPSWMSQAQASGVPWVAVVHTLYDRVAAGILTAFTTLDAINDERTRLGLTQVDDAAALLDAAARVLVTAPRELDDVQTVPANTVHVGPILEEPGPDAGWRPPWPDRPLVVVSPGTTPGLAEERIIQRVLDAVEDRPVHVVVNVGAHIDRALFELPANVELSGYVRHAAVLPHADAVVTHAGLGSISAALAHGLPVVCVALDRDQPHNAERVAAIGVGESVPVDVTPDRLWQVLDRVLIGDRHRAAARAFASDYDPTAAAVIYALENEVAKSPS